MSGVEARWMPLSLVTGALAGSQYRQPKVETRRAASREAQAPAPPACVARDDLCRILTDAPKLLARQSGPRSPPPRHLDLGHPPMGITQWHASFVSESDVGSDAAIALIILNEAVDPWRLKQLWIRGPSCRLLCPRPRSTPSSPPGLLRRRRCQQAA
jgi:hypothetical protein